MCCKPGSTASDSFRRTHHKHLRLRFIENKVATCRRRMVHQLRNLSPSLSYIQWLVLGFDEVWLCPSQAFWRPERTPGIRRRLTCSHLLESFEACRLSSYHEMSCFFCKRPAACFFCNPSLFLPTPPHGGLLRSPLHQCCLRQLAVQLRHSSRRCRASH